MNAKMIGTTISALRRKCGLTQAELAEKLNISNKTISKWENGLGYPEITQLPAIAALFGVSVDYLLTGECNGITIAGSIIVDTVKNISTYPEKGMLSIISGLTKAAGGCAPNTAIDLARIDRSIPISVAGCVGDDDNGNFIMGIMQKNGVNTGMITVTDEVATSFSDVMSLQNGERTFISFRGANDVFAPEHINLSALKCKILHIGYILMLAKFDAPDAEFGTAMARFLHDVRERGIKTSIDLVSENSNRYSVVLPCLKYVDNLIINETEAGALAGIEAKDGNLIEIAKKLKSFGVAERVIIHTPSLGICVSDKGETVVPSYKLPEKFIVGTTGAGDAFCAGALYGIYQGKSDREILEFASSVAVASLSKASATDGIGTEQDIQELCKGFNRKEICL